LPDDPEDAVVDEEEDVDVEAATSYAVSKLCCRWCCAGGE
jgi:hypothetical protein